MYGTNSKCIDNLYKIGGLAASIPFGTIIISISELWDYIKEN